MQLIVWTTELWILFRLLLVTLTRVKASKLDVSNVYNNICTIAPDVKGKIILLVNNTVCSRFLFSFYIISLEI
jgi:hypothetical protein